MSAFNSLFAELRDRADIRGVYITEAHAQVGCAAHQTSVYHMYASPGRLHSREANFQLSAELP